MMEMEMGLRKNKGVKKKGVQMRNYGEDVNIG
jgi:hypothetical protein